MARDTEFAGEVQNDNGSGGGVDALYDRMYEGADQAKEADYKASVEPVPSFNPYVLEFTSVKGRISEQTQMPAARFAAKIVEGPEATVGMTVFFERYLAVSETKSVKRGSERVQEARTQDELSKSVKEWQEVQQRIAGRLGLTQVMVRRPVTEQSIEVWGQQFVGKRCTMELRYDKGDAQFGPKNAAQWQSIRGLEDEVFDKNTGKRLGTAIEVARTEIAKAAMRKQGKQRAGTAAQFENQRPTGFNG